MPFTWLKYVPHGAIDEFYLYCHIVGVCGHASFVPVPYTVFLKISDFYFIYLFTSIVYVTWTGGGVLCLLFYGYSN